MSDLDTPKERTEEELIEEVILPFWLENLNRAKIAYNNVRQGYVSNLRIEETVSQYFYYFSALQNQRILNIGITPEIEKAIKAVSFSTLMKNKRIALVLEHESYMMMMWLKLFFERMGTGAIGTWVTQRLSEESGRFDLIRSGAMMSL